MYAQPMAPMYAQPVMAAPVYAPPPMYAPPPPPPQQQGPTIITIGNNNNSNGTPCMTCGKDTDSIPRKKIGGVAIAWCICLCLTVGSYGLCLIPLCSDNCKDTQLICVKCQTVKTTISANCC